MAGPNDDMAVLAIHNNPFLSESQKNQAVAEQIAGPPKQFAGLFEDRPVLRRFQGVKAPDKKPKRRAQPQPKQMSKGSAHVRQLAQETGFSGGGGDPMAKWLEKYGVGAGPGQFKGVEAPILGRLAPTVVPAADIPALQGRSEGIAGVDLSQMKSDEELTDFITDSGLTMEDFNRIYKRMRARGNF